MSATLIGLLEAGERPAEGELVAALRRRSCPSELIERLAGCRWVLGYRRTLPLLLRHPRCPLHLALEAMPRLGWVSLLEVTGDVRTAPAARRQAEKKLLERLPQLTAGERTALARRAPPALFAALSAMEEPRTLEALLQNPRFTENDAVRLATTGRCAGSLLALVRHPRWGRCPAVAEAALRSERLPLGIGCGLLVERPVAFLERLAADGSVRQALRRLAGELAEQRLQSKGGER